MKRIRKFFFLFLASAMLLAVGAALAACNNGNGKVTLRFDVQGGDPIPSIVAEKGSEVTLPEATREGYAFTGWYLSDGSEGTLRGTVTAPQTDATYHAMWETGYLVTFDLDGGVLQTERALYLAEGADVYEAVSPFVPRKSGLTFGAWFYEGNELARGFKMPAAGITLTARYKADYTVEVYLQNVSGNAYPLNEQYTSYGAGYAGSAFRPDAPAITHFTLADHADSVTELVLSEQAEKNVFRFYYTRDRYPIVYHANAPAGLSATGGTAEQTGAYQASVVTAENGFKLAGYRFAGWASVPDGDVVYRAGERVRVEGYTSLYAVWDRGYTDRFRSDDIVFFPRLEEGKAYLLRGGYEFEGTREGDVFTFKKENGDTMLEGRVSGTMFSYTHRELSGKYVLASHDRDPAFDEAERYDDGVTLEIGDNLVATLTENGVACSGALSFDRSRGDYRFLSDDGKRDLHVLFGDGTEAGHEKIFYIAGEEAGYYLGLLGLELPYTTGEILHLDGYGGAVCYMNFSGTALGFDGEYYLGSVREVAGVQMRKICVTIYDELGLLGSEPAVYVNNLATVPLGMEDGETGEEYDGYIKANGLMGEYRGENGATLVLDGLGLFADSAVYTDADGVHACRYDYVSDNKTGVTVTLAAEDGGMSFKLDGNTFAPIDLSAQESYTEYYRITDSFDSPVLVLYGEEGEAERRAELLISNDGDTFFTGGRGVVTEEMYRGVRVCTFTLTAAEAGYENVMPKSMRFYFSSVMSSEDMRPRDVYCVLEEDGESWYEAYEVEGGGVLWANSRITLLGSGSLLFTQSGAIEGSFSVGHSERFGYDYIAFVYGDENGDRAELRYTVSELEDGTMSAIPLTGSDLELQTYYFDEAENVAQYVTDLVLDRAMENGEIVRSGNAAFNDGHGEGAWQTASFEYVGTTVFGEDVYSLRVGPSERFRFLITLFEGGSGGTAYIYFIYEESVEGTYLSPDGGSLTLDGFYWALYTDGKGGRYEGGYDYDPATGEVYFTPENGEAFYLSLQGDTFYALDGAYGSWTLVDYNFALINNATVTFDGRGNVTVTVPGGMTYTGTYTLLDAETNEYAANVNFGPQSGSFPGGTAPGGWHVQLYSTFSDNLCILFNEPTAGTFINDDWDVLWLDGYGGATLSTADGTVSATGEYVLADEERGFMIFIAYDEDETQTHILFNAEAHTFEIVDYSQICGLYLSDAFDYLALMEDGAVYVGTMRQGVYFYDETTVYAYLWSYDTNTFSWYEFDRPTGDVYDLSFDFDGDGSKETVTYRRVSSDTFTADGKIEFSDVEGEIVRTMSATLTLKLRNGSLYNLAAVFTVTDKEHGGTYDKFSFNPYTGGVPNPRVSYNGVDYPIAFSYENGFTFTVSAGYLRTVMNDYYDMYRNDDGSDPETGDGTVARRGGRIVKESVGFGPISLEAAVYSGEFFYLNDAHPIVAAEPITFSGVPEKELRVIGSRALLNELYEIVFEANGRKYAIDFYETEYENTEGNSIPCYVLQGFYEYEEHTADGYTVGVKYLVRATMQNTPGYDHDEYGDGKLAGKAVAVTLIPDGKAPVVAYDAGISIGGDVWFGELLGYDSAGNVDVGDAYLVHIVYGENGRAERVDVGVYQLRQKRAMGYLINFYVDEEGDVVTVIAVAYTDETTGILAWLENPNGLQNEGNVWTFRAAPGANSTERTYTVTFTKVTTEGEDGAPVYDYIVTVTTE